MSQGQQSDIFPSSNFDDIESNLYGASASQQTLDTLDPDLLFTTPFRPPPIFKRVGPTRAKAYVLYDLEMHTEWTEWWVQTDGGRISKIAWDARRLSEIWKHFEQVADALKGTPMVMCKRCGAIVHHPASLLPSGNARYGTSTLARHLATSVCQRAAGASQTMTKFLQAAVSSLLLIKALH